MKYARSVAVILSLVLVVGCTSTRRIILGTEAKIYISDPKEKLSQGSYTIKELRKRAKDELVGIIFNTDGGGFDYIAWLEEENHFYFRLVMDRGREKDIATKEIADDYVKMVAAKKFRPYVILDRDGNEEGIIYAEPGTQIRVYSNKNGETLLEIGDDLYEGRRALHIWWVKRSGGGSK